jgi:mevalonate kinase
LKRDEDPSPKRLHLASLKRFADYLETMQNEQPELATFDLAELKAILKQGCTLTLVSSQGYGVGSSGALVAAIYDKYAQNKITVLENLTREVIAIKKHILSNGKLFHGKAQD